MPMLLGVAGLCGGVLAIFAVWYYFSPEFTDVGYRPVQPIAYSHRLHVGELGLDCRYCHNTVERAAHAAIPPASTCMNCHAVIGKKRDSLALLRDSFAADKPIPWV